MKKMLEVAARNREVHFQSYLSNWLNVIMTMILQNTISRFKLFEMESFDVTLGTNEHHFEHFQAECVILRIGFDVITTMILQNTISRCNLFRIESFDS